MTSCCNDILKVRRSERPYIRQVGTKREGGTTECKVQGEVRGREERNEQRKQQGREGWKQEMRGKRRGTGTREE